jgi:hypothetical protein
LGTFDEQIRREQEAVARERDARDAAGAGSTTTTDETENSDSESGSAGTEEPRSADNTKPGAGQSKDGSASDGKGSRPGDLKSEKQRGVGKTAGGNQPGGSAGTQKIPDGSNDDIVARRLRKAAEQETDPELKEKLWKEYIEYKKNNG